VLHGKTDLIPLKNRREKIRDGASMKHTRSGRKYGQGLNKERENVRKM